MLQEEHEFQAKVEREKMEADILRIQAELEAQRSAHIP